MAKLDVMETIKKFRGTGKINSRYDLTTSGFQTIRRESMTLFDLICNSFVFGYAQGYKAKTAEIKKVRKQYEKNNINTL